MFSKKIKVPQHLQINGRHCDQNFKVTDKLYRGFCLDDYDDALDTIKTESIKFPDLSCNWDRYSTASDIQYRENGSPNNGCYSLTVELSKYKNIATPVHDPIKHEEYPNYSHTEIRVCRADGTKEEIPPRCRKIGSKKKKIEYRENLSNNLSIEFMAKH